MHRTVLDLLSGSFHEIKDQLRLIDLEKLKDLYKSKKYLSNLEEELGL